MAHYQSDVLINDTSPINRSREEFTLYVNNLPEELNEHGLQQIFNHYGKVIGQFYRPNTNWAYVTYGTYLEAESAIRDLHNVSPLYLKVSFAREKGFNKIQSVKPATSIDVKYNENHNAADVTSMDRPLVQTKGRGKLLDIFRKVETNTADNLLYSYPSDPHTYNPYENAEPFESTNALWTRGQLTVTQDGRRHVSLGRGYTMYEIPDPNPEIQNQISKVHERRAYGFYEYGKDTLQNTSGKCQKCSKITTTTCERCHSFYCSTNCQKADWAQHKLECQAIPALVTAVNFAHLSESNTEEHTSRSMSCTQIPLRRPKKSTNTMKALNQGFNTISKDQDTTVIPAKPCDDSTKMNESECFKTTDQHNAYQRNEAKEKVTAPVHSGINFQSRFQTEEQNNSTFKQSQDSLSCSDKTANSIKLNSLKDIKKQQNFSVEDITKIEEDIAFSKCTFLSKSKFTDVQIIVKLDREYWIQKVEDNESIIQLMINLQCEARQAQKVVPIIGNIYAIRKENLWHRVLVTFLNPLIIQYVDYGNVEVITTDDFRKIDKFKNIPRFAARIRLSEKANERHKNLKYEDIITVKMISVDSNNVINVEVQGENDSTMQVVQTDNTPVQAVPTDLNVDKTQVSLKAPVNDKVLSSLSNLKSVISIMLAKDKGILRSHAKLSNNTYGITLLSSKASADFQQLLTELPLSCEQAAKHFGYRPQIGDIICNQNDDGMWIRGCVLSLETPLKMVAIDEGRMVTVNRTVPCPENLLNICVFGAVCKVIDAKNKFNISEKYDFEMVRRNGANEIVIEIEIPTAPYRLKAIVKPWTPMPEQKGLKYAELKNNCEVCLTAYRNHITLFARPLDTAEVERYNRIMQSVAKCAQTAPLLKEPPDIGQMVISQYIDDNYYRAIVTKVQDDKVTISYIDFGNMEVTNIKKLKIPTDDLKQLQSCTSKIVLKDVPQDVPMTKEISDYLGQLVGAEVPLICTFDGIPSKDGVYLKSHNGENINKTIRELFVPTWKSDEKDTTCYMVSDLPVASLGKVGDTVEAIVLHSIEDGYRYAMCTSDYDLINYVFDILPKAMTEYCKTSEYYIPRENELCIALYEDGWYRAVCICRSSTPTTSTVLFVDFGNTENVSHKDIRLMPKDFITPNALANICKLVNVAPTDSNGLYSTEIEKKISKLVVPEQCIKIKIIECDEEAGIYNVELPLIRSKLIEDGLLS